MKPLINYVIRINQLGIFYFWLGWFDWPSFVQNQNLDFTLKSGPTTSVNIYSATKAVNENLNTIKCCSKKLGWQSYQWWLSESIHSGKVLKGMYPVPSQVWLSFDDYDFMPNNRISAGLNSASTGCVFSPWIQSLNSSPSNQHQWSWLQM